MITIIIVLDGVDQEYVHDTNEHASSHFSWSQMIAKHQQSSMPIPDLDRPAFSKKEQYFGVEVKKSLK